VTILGITGHQNLTPATRRIVAAVMARRLAAFDHGDIVGLTSLAAGADQTLAFCILAAGGRIDAVIPANGYRNTMSGQDQKSYDHLLGLAGSIVELPNETPSEAAYFEAGRFIVDRSDLLIAVWDGQPAAGLGGTGDVVAYAKQQSVDVEVIWPPDSTRA
jgi:hypothetical protein